MTVVVYLSGLLLLTACMKRYDVTYTSSMFVGSFVMSASIMSCIHYDTFQHLHGQTINFIMYPMGLVVLLSGVYVLIWETTTTISTSTYLGTNHCQVVVDTKGDHNDTIDDDGIVPENSTRIVNNLHHINEDGRVIVNDENNYNNNNDTNTVKPLHPRAVVATTTTTGNEVI
jgi:hypothetical protein